MIEQNRPASGGQPPESAAATEESDLPEQVRVRKDKRERILADGRQPYPASVSRTHLLAEVREQFAGLETDQATGEFVAVAGRVVFMRNTGKLCFATLRAGDGTELQAMLSLAAVGEQALESWKAEVDLGDHVWVRGEVITSKRGELSVLAAQWELAAKALRPLPVAHRDLAEQTRVRQRYLDLVMNERSRQVPRVRAGVNRSLRDSFHARDYIEVETPMLQTLQGGAAARPFRTHSNAFDMELYLRIAPELYLKRCVVGGMDRVFEINRNFRNEGSDSTHSPEFVMLEAYQAYADYQDMALLTQQLVQEAADAVLGTRVVEFSDGTVDDLDGHWPRLSLFDSLSDALGEQITPDTPLPHLKSLAARFDLDIADGQPHGAYIEELWEHLVRYTLRAPTFVMDFPIDTSPLTREHRSTTGVVEKWDLYLRGFELATGYSELIDPQQQRERFAQQARLAAGGDEEAMPLDEDFLQALEFGMPPTGGMGMGIDRLLMALTGLGIRETVLFPLVRPE